jgi:hypothetical protein
MVRVKIVCKDASNIPKKRMFEMRKRYAIQFKVKGELELQGIGGGHDGNDGNGDDSDKGGGRPWYGRN